MAVSGDLMGFWGLGVQIADFDFLKIFFCPSVKNVTKKFFDAVKWTV